MANVLISAFAVRPKARVCKVRLTLPVNGHGKFGWIEDCVNLLVHGFAGSNWTGVGFSGITPRM